MRPRDRARTRLRPAALAVLAIAGAAFVLLPALSAAAAPSASQIRPFASGCAAGPGGNGVSANVTWNGVNVCPYSSASSALGVDFSKTEDLHFNWSSSPGSAVSVYDARLQMFYFGFALQTRDQFVTPPQTGGGSFDMNWTPGVLTYVLEGLYKLTASLEAPNGTTVWSEDFFVRASAPYSVLAVLPILLLAIAIYEVYALATAGRHAVPSRRPPAPPPPEPPDTTAEPEPPTEPEPPPDEEANPSEAESAPGPEEEIA